MSGVGTVIVLDGDDNICDTVEFRRRIHTRIEDNLGVGNCVLGKSGNGTHVVAGSLIEGFDCFIKKVSIHGAVFSPLSVGGDIGFDFIFWSRRIGGANITEECGIVIGSETCYGVNVVGVKRISWTRIWVDDNIELNTGVCADTGVEAIPCTRNRVNVEREEDLEEFNHLEDNECDERCALDEV